MPAGSDKRAKRGVHNHAQQLTIGGLCQLVQGQQHQPHITIDHNRAKNSQRITQHLRLNKPLMHTLGTQVLYTTAICGLQIQVKCPACSQCNVGTLPPFKHARHAVKQVSNSNLSATTLRQCTNTLCTEATAMWYGAQTHGAPSNMCR